MGSWWQIEVGKRVAPVFGKNYVSDQLMLIFTDDDRFVDVAKRDELAQLEELSATHPEADQPLTWHRRLMWYSASAEALRSRLALQGFSSERVRSLSTAFFDDEMTQVPEDGGIDQRGSWEEGRGTYPDGASITAALATWRGQAAAQAPRLKLSDPEQRLRRSTVCPRTRSHERPARHHCDARLH